MKLRSQMLLCFLMIVGGSLKAQEVVVDSLQLSLEEAWAKANAYSKELRLRNADLQIGEENVLNAKNAWLPDIETSASYGKLSNIPVFENGILHEPEYIPLNDHSVYDAGIEAYFNLYNGQKVKVQVKQAETRQSLLEYVKENSEAEVHYKVAESYLDLQRSMSFKKLIEQNIYQNKKRLDQITELYNNGVVLKSDLLRAQLQLSQQETNLLTIANNLQLSTQQLNILIGNEDDQQVVPTDSIAVTFRKDELVYEDYLKQTMQSSPVVKIAEHQVALTKLQEKDVKADKLPSIGLFGEYTYSYPQVRLYPYSEAPYLMGVAGIRISYNLSNLYHDKHKEKAAEMQVARGELAKQQTDDKLRLDLSTAYKKLHEDLEQITVAEMNISQAEENYRIVNHTYFNQLALLTDLLTADTQLLQARFNLVNRQISARLHYYQILKITGQL